MNPRLEDVTGLASREGFRPEALEKVLRLGEIIDAVGRHPLLSRALALKGGTALNLFFGPPERLSVDLDFNYVGSVDREQMLRDRPEVERAVTRIGDVLGYAVQQSREEHAGRKIFLRYENVLGVPDRVEIDLNYLFRMPLGPASRLVMWQPPGTPLPVGVFVVGFDELCAGKLLALLARASPRDLFDTVRLPDLGAGAWPGPEFRRLFVALAGVLDHPLFTYDRERFDRATDQRIEAELHPMLRQDRLPAGPDLREGAWNVVSPFLDLDGPSREYTEWLQRGELRPELLFPSGSPVAARLAAHPALLWKAENARRHRADRSR